MNAFYRSARPNCQPDELSPPKPQVAVFRKWQCGIVLLGSSGIRAFEWEYGVRSGLVREANSLRQQGVLISPFPVSPSGEKPGRAGSPHAAKGGRLPPQEGFQTAPLNPPLCIPPLFSRQSFLTTAARDGDCTSATCMLIQ